MPAHRISFSWSPKAQDERSSGADSLAERLRPGALDRAAGAAEVAREAAGELSSWLAERPRGWGADAPACGAELEQGLAEWSRQQGWRGACATLIDATRAAFAQAGDDVRGALTRELERWTAPAGNEAPPWSGRPGEAGRRLTPPESPVPHALRELERGDHVLVHGRSEAVLACLRAAQDAGLAPRVTVAAGSPDHSGKRVARHLASHGLRVRLMWDAAALGAVAEVDRVWLGTEAIGSGEFVGLVGTRLLLDEARRLEVPLAVVCTADACLPGGELLLPPWGEEEGWNLWSQAPEGVELVSQPFERVPGADLDAWITDEGRQTLAELCTRSLRPEPAPPCGAGVLERAKP